MKQSVSRSAAALFCLAACLALVVIPRPARAQGGPNAATASTLGLSISVNPTTVAAGGTVGVFAFVTNNSGSRIRQTVTITSLSACGIENNIGYNKLVLNPGQTVQVTVSYPLAPDACTGSYAVTISAPSGKGGTATTSSATAYFTVQ